MTRMCIEQFNKAGAVNLGKTKMDEFAMGSSNETFLLRAGQKSVESECGTGRQFRRRRLCGRSKALRCCNGNQTPAVRSASRQRCAAFTGIKPTYGTVSRYGMIAFASSLDQAGPMAKSAEDCALMLNVMTGFDERDSTSLQREPEDYTRDLNKPLAGLRIGLPKEFFAEGLSQEVANRVQDAIAEYKKLGATIVDISLPNSKLAVPVYYVLAPAEASSNLSRFDGVRYGYRAPEYTDLADMYEKSRAQGFGEEVKRRIMIGTYVLSHGYYDAYYLQAQKIRRLIAQDFTDAFKQCDVIMGPTSPSTAFNLGEKGDDPVQMYLSDIYTIAVNLAGLPGMSIPCGFGDPGTGGPAMPVGLQIIGNYFDEARMLNIAHQYQLATDWHTRCPQAL